MAQFLNCVKKCHKLVFTGILNDYLGITIRFELFHVFRLIEKAADWKKGAFKINKLLYRQIFIFYSLKITAVRTYLILHYVFKKCLSYFWCYLVNDKVYSWVRSIRFWIDILQGQIVIRKRKTTYICYICT